MKYDIVPVQSCYRGIERSLLATDLYTRRTKGEYEFLLEVYYDYLNTIEFEPSVSGFTELIRFCDKLNNRGISCEVIIFDICPVESAFGFELDFLGIDIVHEMAESLLEEFTNHEVQQLLNQNGLCRSESDADRIIPLLDHGCVKWDLCYVYKVRF